jgi:Tol biopolymer transport system component
MVYISVVAGREQLFISTVDGKDAWQLTTDSVNHEDPAWSPDGTRIAFVSLTATNEQIALIPATGGSIRLVTPATERAIHLNWAPDSRHLAYCTTMTWLPRRKTMPPSGLSTSRPPAFAGSSAAA